MIMNPCLAAAVEYLKKGVSVIPVGRDKKPLIAWKEFQTRRATEQEVVAWWIQWPEANVGIVTGKISGNLVVDVEKGGDISIFPKTCIIKTGGGGWHLYYKYVDFENKVRILPLTDIRGDGGYVVAPPSMHESGNRYGVLERRNMAEFPLHLFGGQYKKNDWREIVRGVPQGSRNEMATKVVGKLLRAFHKTEWEQVAWPMLLQWNQTNVPPMTEYEVRNIFNSISRREAGKTTLDERAVLVEFVPFSKVLDIGIAELEATRAEDIVSFGYDWLDDKMTGIFKGELAVIGGETGTGKTVFATNILYRASKKRKCGVFALEDRLHDYGIKALYFEIGRIRKIKYGQAMRNYPWNDYRKQCVLDPEYPALLQEARENLKNENLFFADVPVQMDMDLFEKLVEEKASEGYQLFLVDHLHYFDLLKDKNTTKADYIEQIMIRMRTLQRRTGARILLVVHYRKLSGARPSLDSFKDSIAIAQNANYVINIWRDRTEKRERDYKTTFSISKSRNPNGEATIEVEFDPAANDYKPVSDWRYGTSETASEKEISVSY